MTKFVTRTTLQNATVIEETAKNFVSKIREEIEDFPRILVNTDQSPIQLESTHGRTLAISGDHDIIGHVQRKSAITHTVTVTPIITADGLLLDPLHVTLQEKNGSFGPRVQEGMFTHPKLFAVASKSGKYFRIRYTVRGFL